MTVGAANADGLETVQLAARALPAMQQFQKLLAPCLQVLSPRNLANVAWLEATHVPHPGSATFCNARHAVLRTLQGYASLWQHRMAPRLMQPRITPCRM